MNLPPSAKATSARRLRYGALFVALVFVTLSFSLSRQTRFQISEEDESWFLEEHEVLARTLEELEDEWQRALYEAALIELKLTERNRRQAAREVIGIRQASYFSPDPPQHLLVEFPLQGTLPLKPGFDPQKSDFLIPETKVFASRNGSWLKINGAPLLYTLSISDTHAVVFSLRTSNDTADIVHSALLEELKKLPLQVTQGGLRKIINPDGTVLLSHGETDRVDHPHDESIRLLSRFGEWTIRYWRPRNEITSYDTPLLLGLNGFAALVALAGWWSAREQERTLRLAQERVSFVNSVSHELRTPLTNILLSCDLLEENLDSPGAHEKLARIQRESQRLSRMVENVLNFARSERGKLTPDPPSPIALDSFFNTIISQFETTLRRKKIHLTCKIEGEKTVCLSRDFTSQILFNLLSNLQKYAPEGARSWIHADTRKDLKIMIGHTGNLIPPGARARIFLPFEQLENNTNSGTGGSGLGLSISRDLARSLGGDLTLEDHPQDTLFLLTLPLS